MGRVRALDDDQGDNSHVSYSFLRGGGISPPSPGLPARPFAVDSTTGDVILTGSLDYERSSEYSLSLVATDRGANPLTGYGRIVVRVRDVNDHAPVIAINALTADGRARVVENGPVGAFVAHVTASDRDSGAGGRVGHLDMLSYVSTGREQKFVTASAS